MVQYEVNIMTKEQKTELNYLLDVVLEASKWSRTPDDDRDCIRMEVEHRINMLTGREDPRDEDLEPETEPENLNEHLSKKYEAKRKWAGKRVRVMIDGKAVWKLRSECRKEVMPGWQTKMHWVWVGKNSPTVDKLSNELEDEHENE